MSTYLRLQTVDLKPEMVSRITAAYEQPLRTLCVRDRDGPLTEMVASKIIKIAQTEVLAPGEIAVLAIKELEMRWFEANVHASPTEIGAAAAAIQEQLKVREERELVDQLREASPVAVSTGVQETLDCLSEGRVLTLVADDSYAADGTHCRQCGCLFETTQLSKCPACGETDLEPIDDLVEAALQQALERRAQVVFVRDPACRSALAEKAPLQALLRY